MQKWMLFEVVNVWLWKWNPLELMRWHTEKLKHKLRKLNAFFSLKSPVSTLTNNENWNIHNSVITCVCFSESSQLSRVYCVFKLSCSVRERIAKKPNIFRTIFILFSIQAQTHTVKIRERRNNISSRSNEKRKTNQIRINL